MLLRWQTQDAPGTQNGQTEDPSFVELLFWRRDEDGRGLTCWQAEEVQGKVQPGNACEGVASTLVSPKAGRWRHHARVRSRRQMFMDLERKGNRKVEENQSGVARRKQQAPHRGRTPLVPARLVVRLRTCHSTEHSPTSFPSQVGTGSACGCFCTRCPSPLVW